MFIKIKIGDMTTLISSEITSRKYTPLAYMYIVYELENVFVIKNS